MPSLILGHNYLMLVSHFTRTQSGYSLSFSGGTAVITDSAQPRFKAVQASCGGDVLRLNIGKKIKCSSISADGSEFFITPSIATINGASGLNCSSQFDTDTLQLRLSQFLPPGNYTLHIKKGGDTNTLLDYCDNSVPETDQLSFAVLPKAPTPIDSIAPLQCAASKVRVVLSKPILCSSIAPDASDFSITGTYPVTISNVTRNCSTANEIILTLSSPLQRAGTFTLNLLKGTDGNTIINECGEETPVGATVSFSVKDTVNADFTYNIQYGCTIDQVQYNHAGANEVTNWRWNLDENMTSTQQNPLASYRVFNDKTVKLSVSNGFCTDSSTQTVSLKNYLKADFTVFEDNCPNEPINFTSKAVGKIVGHRWTFGDGANAVIASPTHTYAAPNRQVPFNVQYTVTDSFGCASTATKPVIIYPSCFLAMPTAFTPNNDGLNDFLRPLNAIKAEQVELLVYNRWGQLIFRTSNWKQGWNGTLNGSVQASGTYVWTLKYINRDTKQTVYLKGTAVLIR
jgi:gliding motility-associated-like protein